MLLRSWPVRYLITRAARAYGFLDPIALMAKLRGFAQPSEVAEPIELLRAGMLFHARGLVNTKAIQNNLDWIWPFWVEKQFNPNDESFIPRAFSFSHINLTHRNWTAVGLPDVAFYPLVDPRGLVTPLFDGWSLDFWLIGDKGETLFPSKQGEYQQVLVLEDNMLRVRSAASSHLGRLETEVSLQLVNQEPVCFVSARVHAERATHLAVALRPYNPEGISTIDTVDVSSDGQSWSVNHRPAVFFDRLPSRNLLSVYAEGDVSQRLLESHTATHASCPVGLATAAALFPVKTLEDSPLSLRAPLVNELEPKKRLVIPRSQPWPEALNGMARLSVADERIQRLFDLAVVNLVLHSPAEVYPGPFTYKRFWFRDAAFVLHGLLALGGVDRTRRALAEFAPRQRRDGYFLSQEGEWDANGEALWTYHRFTLLTGEKLPDAWLDAVAKGARWIMEKRLPKDTGRPEAGLLPAGFSAEHLGPNDFYYWDDFWGVAGLRSAADLLESRDPAFAARCRAEAEDFLKTIEASFPSGPQRRFPLAIPASPKRRMDSGAVGSLVADYPLHVFPAGDVRILRTADYLRDHSTVEGGFFQNMIHSGINAYLTLHLAQVRLRAGEVDAAWRLIERVAQLASPTGQWPEAIHPRTFGGCMGDGQHIWAAGEWALMIRNCFLREEGPALVIASGVAPSWIPASGEAFLGPTLTPWGPVRVSLRRRSDGVLISVAAQWRGNPPELIFQLPAHATQVVSTPSATTDLLVISRP